MPLLPEFPISGDDYTVGTITTTAGKKEFNTKDAYLNSFGAVRPGDHVYISTTGKILVIGSITGENSGTLADPCPDDCAVKDLPLRVIYKTASSRVQGRIAMLLERLSKGYLAAFSEITAKENQIFQATNVDGELKAIDLNADNIAETDKRKFMPDVISADVVKETDKSKIMTAEERNKIAKLDENYLAKSGGTISGALTVTGGIDANVLTVQGKTRLCEGGNITGPDWSYGDLNKHIESRCAAFADDRKNACVTDSRVIGWSELPVTSTTWTHLPSGYFVTSQFGSNAIVGRQPQLYIANRGWFALGGW